MIELGARVRALALLATIAAAGCGRRSASEALPHGDSRASCATCHPAQSDAFATSAHSRSSSSPVLEAMLPRVESAWGAAARARCESCHAPAHSSAEDDVTCISCHAAVGNRAERDGRLVVDPGAGLAGPFDDAEADAQGAHATRRGSFLASPSLCATCHEVTGPELFVEPTWTEHQASPAFAEGEHCADCHMPALEPAPIATAATRSRARRDHSFVGFDPPWDAPPDEAARAAERTRALLASALALRARVAADGDTVAIEIEIENVARGHDVPTGVSMLRDLAVEATHLDAHGAPLAAPERVLELADRPMRGELPVALPTDADRIEVRRLAPGEIRTAHLAPPPGTASTELRVVARAIRRDALDALGLEALETPTHVLAEARVDLRLANGVD